jgi:hypothetical protein
MTIACPPMDESFNNLVDYLNKKVLPVVAILSEKQAVGVVGSEDSFLRNIGNGKTVFDRVRSSDIANYTLSLNKIAKQTPFSVIASDIRENLKTIISFNSNQVLTSDNNLIPKWQQLKFCNFVDSSIDASKVAIGTLSARHLTAGIIGKPLTDDSIITSYIRDNTIPNNKIANGSFTNNKISAALMSTRVAAANLQFQDKCFTTGKIQNNSVDIEQVLFSNAPNDPNIKLTKLYGILSPENIPKNEIEIKLVNSPHTQLKFDAYKQMDSSIIPSKIKPNSLYISTIRTPFNGWVGITTNMRLSKNNLSPEVKAILVNKGGLAP